jgi:uncharacterized protein YlzI (FlbEa/FlbD family)
MTNPTTARERSRINAELFNQSQSLEHKPNSQERVKNNMDLDDETSVVPVHSTTIFKRDPYCDRVERILSNFLKPYAISLAKIQNAIKQREDSLEQLELHLTNKTVPDNITLKNKFIEDIDEEGQSIIYTTILLNRIAAFKAKINTLNESQQAVRQDCANVIQQTPELSNFALSMDFIDKRLSNEYELVILEYNFKQFKDLKQKAAKKAKHLEIKAELAQEIPVSKGEKLMFTNSIKALNNKISNLTKQLNSKGSRQKGAARSKKPSKNAKQSKKPATNTKQVKKANPSNAKKQKNAKAKTKRGKSKRN